MFHQAVFAVLLLLNAPIFWYKHRWNRIMDTRVIKETAPGSDPVRLGRADVGGDASCSVSPSPSSFHRRGRPSPWPTLRRPTPTSRTLAVGATPRYRPVSRWRDRSPIESSWIYFTRPVHRGSLAELHYFLEGALQENITAPERIGIPRRNVDASRQGPAPVCSGNGGDLPAG